MRIQPGLPLSSVSMLAGATLLFFLPVLPPLWAVMAGLAAAAGLCWRWRNAATVVVLFFVVGLAWSQLNAQRRMAERLPAASAPLDVRLEVVVSGIVQQHGDMLSFPAKARLNGKRARLNLRWYDFAPGARVPRPGERWDLDTRLREPRGTSNPGCRHWEDLALRHGLAATGYVRHGSYAGAARVGPLLLAHSLRGRLSQELIAGLAPGDAAPLIVALAVGDRQHLTDRHWRVLRDTGLSHLVAISGLHIGIVAGLALAAGSLAAGLLRRGAATACLFSAACACIYAALAGFALPTQRALICVAVYLAMRLARREPRAAHVLAIALLAILLVDPFAPMDGGFWLSFGAVAIIVYVGTGQLRRSTIGLWRLQLALLVGLSPLMIVLFGQVSLAAPLANLFFVPLFSLLVVPAVLTGVAVFLAHPGLGIVVLGGVCAALETVWPAIVWLGEVEWLLHRPGAVAAVPFSLAVIGSLWLLAPRGWPARWLGLVCLLPAVLPLRAPGPPPGGVSVAVLDVGQGLSVVARTYRHTLLYDTGPKWRSTDAAERIVIPYLRGRRIGRIDRLVVSHGDADHAGGLNSILRVFPQARVLAGGLDDQPHCASGQTWFWDGIRFDILHPPDARSWTGNSGSCVLAISSGNTCVLLTGDIEADAEKSLVRRHRRELECEVVIAPHHGSNTSSSPALVRASQARYLVVSAGYRNRWDLPHASVVDRWRQAGAVVFDTAGSGSILVSVAPGGDVTLTRHRCRERRFWRPRCGSPGSE